jgi:hypothetical protein
MIIFIYISSIKNVFHIWKLRLLASCSFSFLEFLEVVFLEKLVKRVVGKI